MCGLWLNRFSFFSIVAALKCNSEGTSRSAARASDNSMLTSTE
jgi:hypothetical protein